MVAISEPKPSKDHFQDRTGEFLACVNSVKLRDARATQFNLRDSKSPEILSDNLSKLDREYSIQKSGQGQFKSNFAASAYEIVTEIGAISERLQKLTMLAKRRTLFDDRPVEITELTYVIKQDIASLNRKLADLRSGLSHSKGRSVRQIEDHNQHVLASLQNRLADASLSFKDILETRSQNMKAAKSREARFTSKSSSDSGRISNSILRDEIRNRNAMRPPTAATSTTGRLTLELQEDNAPINGPTSSQQLMLLEQNDQYLGERNIAIESIEKTIGELGSMFSQLMQLVAEQRDTIQRIEYDADDISTNVSGAHRELLKFYARISSNRWLYLKMFGIILVFFFMFVLFS